MLTREDRGPLLLLALLPALVHLPALSGWFRFDPLYVVSGLTAGTWTTNGWLAGWPGWIDGNAGVTTEALGALAAHQWLSGHIPWWNAYSGIGLPLVAEGQTTAMFLPFGLLLALPHGLLALRMTLMALAGLFSHALLRRLGMARLAATVGAMLFELNGTFAWFAHGPIMPVAFLPLLLLGLEQARDGGRPVCKVPVAAILGTAMSFLAGFPETAALNLLFAGLWGALRLASAPRRLAYAARIGAAVLCGLLLASPAIWPFVEALPREFLGGHAGGHGGGQGGGWQRADLGLMLFPYSQGNLLANILGGQDPGAGWWRVGGFVDLVQLALALAALRRRAPQMALRILLAAWLAVTAARAAGWAPAVALFDLPPLLRQAAVALYMMSSWSMASAILAAFTLQDWQHGRRPNWLLPALLLAPLAVAALVWSARPVALAPGGLAALAFAMPVLVLAAAVVVLRRPPTPRRRHAIAWLIGGHAAVLFCLPLLAGTHGRRLDDAAIRFLQARIGLARVATFGPMTPNYGAMFGIAELNHNYLPVPQVWVDAIRARLQPGSDGVNFNLAATPAAAPAGLPAALRDMGVAYILTSPSQTLPAGFDSPAPVYRDDLMAIWALPDPAPYVEAPGCRLAATRDSVTATCPAAAWLIRRELFWPGWRATVNGAPARLRSAGLFQRIDLPAGRSHVVFRYAPPGIVFAWLACATGGLGLVAATLAAWRGRRAGPAMRQNDDETAGARAAIFAAG